MQFPSGNIRGADRRNKCSRGGVPGACFNNRFGERNYAPTIAPGLMVFDDDPEIAGFYEEDGIFNGKPKYKNCEDTGYYLYFINTAEKWVIDEVLTLTDETDADRCQKDKPTLDHPDLVLIWNNSNTTVKNNITGPIISGADLSSVNPGSTVIKAYFLYSDKDLDAAGDCSFIWFRCTNDIDTGEVIPGINNREYTVQTRDINQFLRVEITPSAETGIMQGDTISGPLSDCLKK